MRGSRFCYYLMVVMFIYTILIHATSIPLSGIYNDVILIVGIFFGTMVYSVKENPKGIIDTTIYNHFGIDCELTQIQRIAIIFFFIGLGLLFIGIYAELNCWTFSDIFSKAGFIETITTTGYLVYCNYLQKDKKLLNNCNINNQKEDENDHEDDTKTVISELIYTGAIALLIGAIELRLIHFIY